MFGYVIQIRSDGEFPEYDSVYSTIKEARDAYTSECFRHRGKSEVSMFRRWDLRLLHRQEIKEVRP